MHIRRTMSFDHVYLSANEACHALSGFDPVGMKTDAVASAVFAQENNLSEVINNIVRLNEIAFRGQEASTLSVAIIDNIPNYFIGHTYPLMQNDKKIIGSQFVSTQLINPPISTIGYLMSQPGMQISDYCKKVMRQLKVLPDNSYSLSQREKQCLDLLIEGYSSKSIAKKLKLSPRTVEGYIVNIKIKLDVTKNIQIVAKSLAENITL